MSKNRTTAGALDTTRLISRTHVLPEAHLAGQSIAVLSVEQGAYFGFEGIAADIWKLTESPIPVGDLVATLVELYDVDERTCHRDIEEFLQDLLSRNLIEIG
jgi:hypothetical protein